LPAALRDDPAKPLQLPAEPQVIRVSRTHRCQRLVQCLEAQIPNERAVDVLFFGVDVPALRNCARIDLSGEKVFTERDERRSENHVSRGELLSGWLLGLFDGGDRRGERPDWIVAHTHAIRVCREECVRQRFGARLVQSVAG
jgi:hypothetical protein